MASVLITAFEPYDEWPANASWLCLLELTRQLPRQPEITTRLYPVDFARVRQRLERDLDAHYDIVLHLGQAPGSAAVRLEAVGLNLGGTAKGSVNPLADDGPVAYRTSLPLADWAARLREAGIPAEVSYHAGTYLCNAALYWSHYFAERRRLKTRSAFVHLPLDPSQVLAAGQTLPSLPSATAAAALRLLLAQCL